MVHRWAARDGSSASRIAVVAMAAVALTLAGCSRGVAGAGDSTSPPPTASVPSASPALTPAPTASRTPAGSPPLAMTPAQARADTGELLRGACFAHNKDTAAPDPEACTFGFFDGDTVVLYGDSHAAQWFDAAEEVAARHDWRLLPVTKEACPPGGERVNDQSRARDYTECTQWHANAMRLIQEQEPILVLVAADSDRYRIVEDGNTLSVQASSDRLGHALEDDLRAFADMGARTVLIRDTPVPGFDVADCIEAEGPDVCTYRLADAMPSDAAQLAAAKATRTPVVDLRREVCGDRDNCRTLIDGLITFRDAEHLTATFGRTLADELEAGIEALPA